jgi:hypothetical protein
MRISIDGPSVQPPKHLTGPELARWVKRAGATTRAHLAEALRDGSIRVSELTHAQAVVLAQVNGVYVSTLHGLTPDEHACVERGSLSLAELSRRRRNGNGNGQHQ